MTEPTLRDQLFAAEPPSAELERRYRQRLLALTERRLTTPERGGLVIGLLLAIGVGAWFVRLLMTLPPEHSTYGQVVLAVGLALCAGWAAYAIVVLRRGTDDLRRNRSLLGNLVLLSTAGMVLMLFWSAAQQTDAARGNHKLLIAVLVWTMAGLPYYVMHVVREHGLRMREDLLRLELALAERDEKRR